MSKKGKAKEVPTKGVSLITLASKGSSVSEQYRTIRTNIQFVSSADSEVKTLVVTSAGPGEGKSTSAANLAVVFADAGQRVLLVDADMRRPTVAKTFAINNNAGLSNLLITRQALSTMVHAEIIPNLSVIVSGPKPPNPSELLDSRRMEELIGEMRYSYDVVIFDMPPMLAAPDAQILASKADGTIMVVRERVTQKDSAKKAKELLKIAKANVLGVIYNGSTSVTDQGYYYYGYGN